MPTPEQSHLSGWDPGDNVTVPKLFEYVTLVTMFPSMICSFTESMIAYLGMAAIEVNVVVSVMSGWVSKAPAKVRSPHWANCHLETAEIVTDVMATQVPEVRR